jgi:hypothetical protein
MKPDAAGCCGVMLACPPWGCCCCCEENLQHCDEPCLLPVSTSVSSVRDARNRVEPESGVCGPPRPCLLLWLPCFAAVCIQERLVWHGTLKLRRLVCTSNIVSSATSIDAISMCWPCGCLAQLPNSRQDWISHHACTLIIHA